MASMMKQAQQMQSNMKKLQAELDKHEITGSAGGDMVSITMTCKHTVTAVKVNPAVVDADDIETLEDLITAAFNDTSNKVATHIEAKMKKITGGMNIPGM